MRKKTVRFAANLDLHRCHQDAQARHRKDAAPPLCLCRRPRLSSSSACWRFRIASTATVCHHPGGVPTRPDEEFSTHSAEPSAARIGQRSSWTVSSH